MTLSADIARVATDAALLHSMINGPSGTTVPTDSGPVPTVAETLFRIAGGVPRGAWAPGTLYHMNEVVTESGSVWVSTMDHLSAEPGGFLLDVAAGYWFQRPTQITDPATAASQVAPYLPAMRNKFINGNFDVCQRGASIAVPATTYAYSFDRFLAYSYTNALTISQVATGVAGSRYNAKVQRNAGQTGANAVMFCQVLETQDSIKLAGKTVTLSFWVKAGANFSGASLGVVLGSSTGVDQSAANLIGASWAGVTYPISTTRSITTNFQKISITAAIPANCSQVGMYVYYTPAGTAGADDSFTIAQVQLEEGPVATPFEQRPIGLELMLCQRYLPAFNYQSGNQGFCPCYANTSTEVRAWFPFQVKARIAPSGILNSAASGFVAQMAGSVNVPASALAITSIVSDVGALLTFTCSGATQGDGGALYNASSGYILFTGCEL